MEFSWKRILKIVGWVALICALVGGFYLAVAARATRTAWASLARNSREHFLDCEQLPFYSQVEKAFREHADVAAKARGVSGVIAFEPQSINCKIYEGGTEFIKGEAVLKYRGRGARRQAESVIGKDFFGIPYRGYESNN